MKKRQLLITVLTGVVCLAVGIVLGQAVDMDQLQGTAAGAIPSGDSFIIDGQTYSMDDMVTMLNLSRTELLDQQMADQTAVIQQRNQDLKDSSDMLARIRLCNSEKTALTQEIFDFFDERSITIEGQPGETLSDAQWDANIESLKGYIDSLNSQSELDMIRLQSLMDKRNQAFDMASNMLSKDQQTRDSIIGNMR